MDTIKNLRPRDDGTPGIDDPWYSSSMSPLALAFSTLLLLGAVSSLALLYLRRKRLARQRAALPMYHQPSHHRSASISNMPRSEAFFVYDEKMNLIANSSGCPPSSIPEIHITFPDEESSSGERQKGRVVVVHVTDSGSVGMAPVSQDSLPPYQRSDAERFQSLDLERIGGLREKEPAQQRWS